MGTTPATDSASPRTRVRRAVREVASTGTVVPLLFVLGVFALFLPLGLRSPLIGGALIGLTGLVALTTALGTERASFVMMVLAFGFAPLTALSLGPKPLVLASGFFTVAFFLVLPHLVHRPLRLPPTFLIGAVLFTTMGLVSLPLAISWIESATYVVTAVVALIAIPMAVAWMAPTNQQMYWMMLAFGAGTAASTLIGLPGNFYRNAGFTYHPVALAYTAMLTLSFVPYLITSKERTRWLLVPPITLLALVGVWTSGSRTSLVVMFALAVIVPVMERSLKLGLTVIGAGVVAFPLFVTFADSAGSTSALSRLFGDGGARNSDTTRLTTLRDGWEQVQQSPLLGTGYSTEHTYTIHNLYLQVLAAEGPIGLIGILLLFSAFIVPLRNASAPLRCLAYPPLAVLLAGPFQPNMADHYLALTLGLSLVAVNRATSDPPPDDGTPKPRYGDVPATRV